MALPYSKSKTNPMLARVRIENILKKFQVEQVNFNQDYKRLEIRLSFLMKSIPITIPINYKNLAQKYYEQDYNPLSFDGELTNKQEAFLKIGLNAAYAAMEDYLKAMLTMTELGIMPLEEVFLPNIDIQGVRLIEYVRSKVPSLLNGSPLFLEG